MPTTTSPATFTSHEACRRAGVTYRQLDYWCRTGRLEPTARDAHGSGSRRQFMPADVVVAAVLGKLSAMGCREDVLTAAGRSLAWYLDGVDLASVERLFVTTQGAVLPAMATGWEAEGWVVAVPAGLTEA